VEAATAPAVSIPALINNLLDMDAGIKAILLPMSFMFYKSDVT
jgi:hypothetical protein